MTLLFSSLLLSPRVSLSIVSLLAMARPSLRREASPISAPDHPQSTLTVPQILSRSIILELFSTVQSSIRAGIGTCCVPGYIRPYSDHVYSNEPFKTMIGVGKVIKGWDEGVPQLSLGEKAVLTATPDYVS